MTEKFLIVEMLAMEKLLSRSSNMEPTGYGSSALHLRPVVSFLPPSKQVGAMCRLSPA
jgi:hypothetical protein